MSPEATIEGGTARRLGFERRTSERGGDEVVSPSLPRLGFVGLGINGRARLDAMVAAGAADGGALCDVAPGPLGDAAGAHHRADCFDDPAELFAEAGRLRLDGVVLATPDADQAGLAVAALERGLAVLCRAPLAAGAMECRWVIEAARQADRPLAIDLPYRGLPGVTRALRRVRAGVLGRVNHVHGVFHQAETGGRSLGAFRALGIHLLDLTFGLLGRPPVERIVARCYREGRPLSPPVTEAEDLATAHLQFASEEETGGASADLTASRGAHAGSECIFRLEVFGTRGGLELVDLDGSPGGLELAVREGTRRTVVARSDEADLAASAIGWARRLTHGGRFTAETHEALALAEAIDRIYGLAPEASTLAARRGARTADVASGEAVPLRASA